VPSDATPKLDLVIHPFDISAQHFVRAAQLAEEAGFDGVWTYDHISAVSFRTTASLDVWSMLAAAAVGTTNIELGPLVINTTVRHPAHIAVAAATLQDLASGRLILGLGAGSGPEQNFADEMRMVGLTAHDAATRRTTVIETIGFLRSLWNGGTSFAGSQFQLNEPAAIVQPKPAPPIVVGANGPKMAALAGTYADMVNLHSWERDIEHLATVSRNHAEAAGNTSFALTVEGPHTDHWIDPSSDVRALVHNLGVQRVMVQWSMANGFDAIGRAGRRLRT
jgi:alkanesulfonate monooxygenase SsuD/methylene tetrahydromethanopterin reductase-like flavin-dependent oxidoreductase (luciferase family)